MIPPFTHPHPLGSFFGFPQAIRDNDLWHPRRSDCPFRRRPSQGRSPPAARQRGWLRSPRAAFHRRSAIEVPWPRFPAANRFIAAFAAMNLRSPATSARLCRRALASAPTVPLGHVGLSPLAPGVACHRSSDGLHPISFPSPELRVVRLEERRSSTSAWSIRSASTTVESPNPAGPGALPSRPFRGALASFLPVQSGPRRLWRSGFNRALGDRFRSRRRDLPRPHAAEPVLPSQELEPAEQVHRIPTGSQRPLLARRPLQSLVTPTRPNRAPLVADLVMSAGDRRHRLISAIVGAKMGASNRPSMSALFARSPGATRTSARRTAFRRTFASRAV